MSHMMQGEQLNSPNPPQLEESLAKISASLQTMNAEIQSLKKQVEAGQGGETRAEKAVDLYRYWKESIKGNFYTTDFSKFGGGNYGWVYKGVVGRVFSSPVEGAVPLYRFCVLDSSTNTNCRDKRHCLYTSDWAALNERLRFGANGGRTLEGICCYIFPSPVEGTKPLFRFYNKSTIDHFLTTDWEQIEEGKDEYFARGVAGYVF